MMPYTRTVLNRKLVARHAAPAAIKAFIQEVLDAQAQADEEFHWLADLYEAKTNPDQVGEPG